MSRIGLLGGAFTPPHAGHLRLAELGWRALGLAEVRFVPTATSPHKPEPAETPAPEARVRLLEEALKDLPFPVCVATLELARGGISYTVDTIEALRAVEPGHQWILLLGSDQLALLPQWHRLDRILELAALAVARRPGAETPPPPVHAHRICGHWSGAPGEIVWLPPTDLDLASSGIRARLAARQPGPGLPAAVEAAIMRENLYR